MLLGEFRRRVDVAGVDRGVLGDQAGPQVGAAHRAPGLEAPGVEVRDSPGARPHHPVPLAGVPPLPVHHHRPGEHEPPYPRLGHRGQQHRRTEVIARDVLDGVREALAEPDHRRLMADGVDTGEGARELHGIPYVAAFPQVVHHRLVPARGQCRDDV